MESLRNNRDQRDETEEPVCPVLYLGEHGPGGRSLHAGLVEMSRLAEGRVGLIITNHPYVRKDGQASAWQLGIYKDERVPGLREMVDATTGAGPWWPSLRTPGYPSMRSSRA